MPNQLPPDRRLRSEKPDGNLIIRAGNQPAMGSPLVMQSDRNAMVYAMGGPAWATDIVLPPPTPATVVSDQLAPGERLRPGEFIVSQDGRFRLILQGDGNLVLYDPRPVWASNTEGHPVSFAAMQADGNLVIYAGNQAVWASHTEGHPGSRLVMQNDRNAVIYGPGGPTWATNTVLPPPTPGAVTFNSGPLTTPDSLPLSGWMKLTLRQDGLFTFSGHAHDAGFDNIDYKTVAIAMMPSGIAYAWEHSGSVEGTIAGLPFGTPRRDDDWLITDSRKEIGENWDQLSQAAFICRIDGRNRLLADLKDSVGEILKSLGKAAPGAVVAMLL